MNGLRGRGRDDGETLIEILLSITILGICVGGIGASIAFAVRASGIHRSQAVASQYLHNYAETLQSDYKTCTDTAAATASSYTAELTAAPAGFAAPAVTIAFWNGTRFVTNGGACLKPDPGLQRVTVTLASTDGHVNESLAVVIRNTT
jgi:type II secretory pathway pseudopilin PulG